MYVHSDVTKTQKTPQPQSLADRAVPHTPIREFTAPPELLAAFADGSPNISSMAHPCQYSANSYGLKSATKMFKNTKTIWPTNKIITVNNEILMLHTQHEMQDIGKIDW